MKPNCVDTLNFCLSTVKTTKYCLSNRNKSHNNSLEEKILEDIPNDHDVEENLYSEDTNVNEAKPESNEIYLDEKYIMSTLPSMVHAVSSFATMPKINQDQSVEESILHSNYFLNFE